MPQQLQAVLILCRDQRNPGVVIDHAGKVLDLAIDADGERGLGQTGPDVRGDLGTGDRMLVDTHAAVGKRDLEGMDGYLMMFQRIKRTYGG